jgi:NADH-quinone oxidoreductase subunit N
VEAGGVVGMLAVLAVVNAAAAAFYYLRVVVYMFMRESADERPALAHGRLTWAGLGLATVGTIALGLVPIPVLDAAGAAADAIGVAVRTIGAN